MFCKNCGQQIDDSAMVCPNCGVATDNFKANANVAATAEKKTNGVGIAGFVLALIGFLGGGYLFCIPNIVGLILSIVGVAKRKSYTSANGLAIAGLVISIISCFGWILIWVLAAGVLMAGLA